MKLEKMVRKHRKEKGNAPAVPAPIGSGLTSLATLRESMDRLFEDFAKGELAWPTGPGAFGSVPFPTIDVTERDGSIEVTAELAGMDEKEVEVSLAGSNDVLVLSGEKHLEEKRKENEVHHVERIYGSFRRSVALPCEVDPEKIEATFDKGVLTVRLPKAEGATAHVRKIPIKAA